MAAAKTIRDNAKPKENDMIMDDPGPAIFEANPDDEFRLSFTVPDAAEPGGRRPIMTMRCFDEDKLRGTVVWLGEHQHLWPEWRVVAEVAGGNEMSARMADLMTENSIARFGSANYLCEACIGATVKHGERPREVVISMTLATRTLPVIAHAFVDERSRDAFMSSLAAPDRALGIVELGELALLRGRNALARKLDELARTRDVLGRRAGH